MALVTLVLAEGKGTVTQSSRVLLIDRSIDEQASAMA